MYIVLPQMSSATYNFAFIDTSLLNNAFSAKVDLPLTVKFSATVALLWTVIFPITFALLPTNKFDEIVSSPVTCKLLFAYNVSTLVTVPLNNEFSEISRPFLPVIKPLDNKVPSISVLLPTFKLLLNVAFMFAYIDWLVEISPLITV